MIKSKRFLGITIALLFGSAPSAEAKLFVPTADVVPVYSFFYQNGQRIRVGESGGFHPQFGTLSSPISDAFPTVELKLCEVSSTPRDYQTASIDPNCEGFQIAGSLGYLLKFPVPGTVPIYRFIHRSAKVPFDALWVTPDPISPVAEGFTDRTILGFGFSLRPNKVRPENASWVQIFGLVGQSGSALGDQMLSPLKTEGSPTYGYSRDEFFVSTTPTSDDDIVLGRCNMAQTNDDHFATTAENCLGAFRETIIGYIAKGPRPGFVPLYRYFKKSKEERWMTTLPIEKLGDSEYVLEKIEGYVSPVSLSPAPAPSPAPSSSP